MKLKLVTADLMFCTPFFSFQGMDDLQVRAAATDIFSYLVEFSPSMVREFVMQEPQQTDDVSIFTWHKCVFHFSDNTEEFGAAQIN